MNHNTKYIASGFSLIEFMIAMMLGLILILGISQYFLSSRQVSQVNDNLNEFSDYSKFISSRLSQELRMVDYAGVLKTPPTNLLKNASDLQYDFLTGIRGYNNIQQNTLPTEISSYLDLDPVNQSDILVLHSTYDVTPVPLSADSTTDSLTISTINGSSRGCASGTAHSGICTGDIALISDFTKSKVFQVSSISNSGEITHTASGAPGNDTTAWSDSDLQFDTTAEVMPLRTIVYYLASENGVTGLYRKENGETSQLIIPNVSNFQVKYGVDTDGDKSVNEYKDANNIADWSSVLSVRVALLLASSNDHLSSEHQTNIPEPFLLDGSTTATDYRLYRQLLFTTTIRNRIQ